jgi:hypothetical protein
MERFFTGNKYNFKIYNFALREKQSLFLIKALHKPTKKTSFITNINVILSELNILSSVPKFWESEWIINEEEARNLIVSVKQLLSDKKFLPYLEKHLDLDRKESEWEDYG